MELVTKRIKKIKFRNSSIELLKIFAMLLIAISHSVPMGNNIGNIDGFDINIASSSITNFILVLLKNLGHIGNLIFIISSSYFLVDSQKNKFEKVLNLIIDTLTISLIFLFTIIGCGIDISIKEIVKQFFPTILVNNWFVSCYLIIYIIHPLLNIIIKKLNQKEFFRLNILFIIYLLIQFVFEGKFFYNNLIGYIIVYFLVAYMKFYMPKFQKDKKFNCIILILSITMYILIMIIINILGLHFSIFSQKMLYFDRFSNIFFICIGISLFNIANGKIFVSKIINYVSSLSLYFYLIHENNLFATYIRPVFYNMVFQYGKIIVWVLLEAIILFLGGIILACVYRETIEKLTKKLTKKFYKFIIEIYLKFEKTYILKV